MPQAMPQVSRTAIRALCNNKTATVGSSVRGGAWCASGSASLAVSSPVATLPILFFTRLVGRDFYATSTRLLDDGGLYTLVSTRSRATGEKTSGDRARRVFYADVVSRKFRRGKFLTGPPVQLRSGRVLSFGLGAGNRPIEPAGTAPWSMGLDLVRAPFAFGRAWPSRRRQTDSTQKRELAYD